MIIDGLKLLGHNLVLHPKFLHLLVLLDVHLPARLLPSRLLSIVVVFEYFRLIIDSSEYLIVLIEFSEFISLIPLDVLQVIYRALIHQGLFVGLRQVIILIFLFLVVFFLFFLLLCPLLLERIRQLLCLLLCALVLQLT